jgi:hypothetical protein
MGHGVMFFNNYELFQALELCDNLKGAWEQSSCWSGVYMENVIADGFEHTTSYLKPDDPLYPCDAVSDKYKNTCYLMQTSYMLKVTGHDFKKVFELCGQAGEPYIDTCYQSLGRDASGQSLSNVDTTARICSLGKDGRQQVHCLIGAVKDFISYYHSDVQARQLCTVAPKELQKICTDTVDSYYATF